jgi:hypothetical protein
LEALCTRDWRRVVDFHATLLADHLAQDILAPASHTVCLGAAHEALAMRELGVAKFVVVHKTCSPPLVVTAAHNSRLPFDTNSIDFDFAGRALDTADARPTLPPRPRES